jgi:hypothetical protein
MGRACSKNGRKKTRMCIAYWWESQKERDLHRYVNHIKIDLREIG